MRVVAAGIADDAVAAFGVGERGDFVVSAAQFEGADGLQALGLQVEFMAGLLARVGKERRAGGDSAQAGGGESDVVEADHGESGHYIRRATGTHICQSGQMWGTMTFDNLGEPKLISL